MVVSVLVAAGRWKRPSVSVLAASEGGGKKNWNRVEVDPLFSDAPAECSACRLIQGEKNLIKRGEEAARIGESLRLLKVFISSE